MPVNSEKGEGSSGKAVKLAMLYVLLIFLVSFLTTFLMFPIAIPRLKRVGISGKDMNKPHQPQIAEMGGIILAAGFCAGIIMAIGIKTFFSRLLTIDLLSMLGALSVVLVVTLIGIVDDLIKVRQGAKAILPLLASLPLIATKAGQTLIIIPFIGPVNMGIFYSLAIVPIGITGSANAFNMLAGFNGMEAGMGLVAVGSLGIIAYLLKSTTSLVLLVAAMGALIATLHYNWYPSKVFLGDVGTFSIGAIIATAVILGNFEWAGIIIIIPYAYDAFMKFIHHLPSKGWWGVYRNGKLYCPESGPVGLCQQIMKWSGGIAEKNLVLLLIGIEALFGATAIILYLWFLR